MKRTVWPAFVAVAAVAAWAGRAGGADASRPATVARFNLSRAFAQSPQMKRLASEVEALFGARQRELAQTKASLESRLKESANGRPITVGGATEEQRKWLAELETTTTQLREVLSRIDARKRDFLREFDGVLGAAVKSAGAQRGTDVVLATTDVEWEQPDPTAANLALALTKRQIWYASENVPDVTDAVLEALDASERARK